VLAGVNGTDPFAIMDHLLDELKALGFAGVQNFPTVGLIDGDFRANLRKPGMGFCARDRHDPDGPCEGHADHALRLLGT
jgi:predicted TIM-barrel enzyme